MMSHVTEFTEYETPDGEIFSFDAIWRFLVSEDGFGQPPVEYISQRGPFQHGTTIIDYRLGPRLIQLVLRQDGCNRQDYWDKRAELLDILRPNRADLEGFGPGILRRKFSDGRVLELKAYPTEGPSFSSGGGDRWDEWGYTETIRFIASDPIAYDPEEKNVNWILAPQSDLEFPITFPITFGETILYGTFDFHYKGKWLTYPKIEIIGPLNKPTIFQLTTKEKIQLLYNISPGEVITMNLQYGNKFITNNYGADLTGLPTNDSQFATFHIEPGNKIRSNGENSISVRASGANTSSKISLTYLDRYTGY